MKRKQFLRTLVLALVLAAGCGSNINVRQKQEQPVAEGKSQKANKESREKIDEWAKKLYEKDPEIRSSAAASLLSSDNPRALEALLKVLRKEESFLFLDLLGKEEKDNARISVIKAFGVKEDDRALELMIAALEDKNPGVREAAAASLGRLKSAEAIQRMAQELKRAGVSVGTRRCLVKALGETRSRLAVAPLIDALSDEDEGIRAAAQGGLERIANQSFGPDPAKWREWWRVNEMKDREEWLQDDVERLERKVSLLEQENESLRKEVAQKTMALLEALPADAGPKPFVEAIKSKYPRVRAFAAKKLSAIKAEESVTALIAALSDDELEIRLAAASGLGKLGDKRALKPLSQRLADSEATMRTAVVIALGSLGDPGALNSLLAALQDESGDVRSAAAHQLGQLGDKRATLPLIRLLGDETPKVREAAAAALGKLRDPRAVQPLIEVMKDKDERARFFAADSLGEMASEEAIDPLVELLSDPNPQVRGAAANALGKIGSNRAIDPLAAALGDEDESVAAEAANALVSIAGDDPQRLAKVSTILYDSGDFKRSAETIPKLLNLQKGKQTDELWEIKRKLARAYLQLKEWNKALPVLGELCDHYPDDPSLRSALGQSQIETKAYDSALSLCSECLQKFPEQSDQWWQFRIAVITAYLSDGRCDEAIKAIDGFKEASPDLGGERVKAELLKLRSEAEKKRKEKEAKEK